MCSRRPVIPRAVAAFLVAGVAVRGGGVGGGILVVVVFVVFLAAAVAVAVAPTVAVAAVALTVAAEILQMSPLLQPLRTPPSCYYNSIGNDF